MNPRWPMRFRDACSLAAFLLLLLAGAKGQDARDEVAAKIKDGVRSGTIAYRLTEPAEIEALFGRPPSVREGKDGGFDLLFWEYPGLTVRFGRMRSAGAPFVLHELRFQGEPVDVGQGRKLSLRTADDLRKVDTFWGLTNTTLSRLDLRERLELLDSMNFDTLTEWPPADRLPDGFDPARILENAATPGLGVRGLHEKGIDGKGIGLAIVDQPLLLGHQEYAGRLVRYDATGLAGMSAQMHASPVASIAVGRTLGVAPGATLTFFAIPTWQRDNEPYTRSLRAILALNEKLPAAERIRVVSISTGMFPRQPHFEEWKAALEETEKSGVLVVTCDPNDLPYGILSLRVGADPDDPASYGRSAYSGKDDLVLVPGKNRTVASHLGEDVYTFDRRGGMSWGAPYIAGLAALAFQVDPGLSPGDIRRALVEAARRTEAGPVVDPAAFIARVRARRTIPPRPRITIGSSFSNGPSAQDLEFTLRREALDRSGLPITPIQGTLDFGDASPPGILKVPASLASVGYAEIVLSETAKLLGLRGTDASGAAVYVFDRNGDGDLANDAPIAFDKPGGPGTAVVTIAYRDLIRGKPVPKTTELVLQEGRAGRIEYHFNELWRASLRNGAETLEVALQRWPIIFMDAKFDGSYDKVFFVEREVLGLGGKFFRLRPDFAGETLRLEEVDRKPVDAGYPAPDFDVAVWGSDERFKLSEHRGEIVVLTFWSPRCGGSRAEAELYDALAEEFKSDHRIRFVAVVSDADGLADFLKARRHLFTHVVDPGLWSTYGVTAPFVTFVIDGETRIVRRTFRFGPEIGSDLRKLAAKR